MKRVNLYKLYQIAQKNNEPLLMSTANLSLFPFMKDYADNYEDYDNWIAKRYGDFYPTWNLQYVLNADSVYTNFRIDTKSEIRKNALSYQKMYDALNLTYDPIENYNRIEEGTDSHTGTDTMHDDFDSVKVDRNYGEHVQNNSYGAKENSNKHSVYGFNSSSAVSDSEDVENEGAKQDTLTTSAKQDSESTAARSDVHENVKNLTDTHKLNVHGNIGVTTSQQMLESEINLRKRINFYEDLIFDLIKNLCNYYNEGVDAFGLAEDGYYDHDNDTTGIDIELTNVQNGVTITVKEDGKVTDQATVYNGENGKDGTDGKNGKDGVTPEFKLEDGNLYVNYEVNNNG